MINASLAAASQANVATGRYTLLGFRYIRIFISTHIDIAIRQQILIGILIVGLPGKVFAWFVPLMGMRKTSVPER